MAELFLQELEPAFVAQATADVGFDFFLGFDNAKGGINAYAVEVKASERLFPERYHLDRKIYDRLAQSNIPAFLLVVDVKQNRVYYAWPSRDESPANSASKRLVIPLIELTDEEKVALRTRLAG